MVIFIHEKEQNTQTREERIFWTLSKKVLPSDRPLTIKRCRGRGQWGVKSKELRSRWGLPLHVFDSL